MTLQFYIKQSLNNKIKFRIASAYQYIPEQIQQMTQIAPKTKKARTVFNYQSYIQAQDQQQYIHQLLLIMLHKRKLNSTSSLLCMNQLNDILNQLEIPLKIKQLHQLYLFVTYVKNQSKAQAKQRLLSLMNNQNQKRKIDSHATAKWINQNIKKANIKFNKNRTRAMSSEANTQVIRASSGVDNQANLSGDYGKKWRLPPIRGTSSQKLTEELKYLVEIFEEMEKQRQNSGLIPINLQSDNQQLDLSTANIPYDPELYELNKNLAKLRIKAEDRLARIIQLARDEPRIKVKLEQAIEKFQRVRIEANQKVGRLGSMKAQKRLIQNKKKQQNKIKNLKLGEQQDLLRAAKLYSLLSIQQRKPSKLIL